MTRSSHIQTRLSGDWSMPVLHADLLKFREFSIQIGIPALVSSLRILEGHLNLPRILRPQVSITES